jgi:hypothetical protein
VSRALTANPAAFSVGSHRSVGLQQRFPTELHDARTSCVRAGFAVSACRCHRGLRLCVSALRAEGLMSPSAREHLVASSMRTRSDASFASFRLRVALGFECSDPGLTAAYTPSWTGLSSTYVRRSRRACLCRSEQLETTLEGVERMPFDPGCRARARLVLLMT